MADVRRRKPINPKLTKDKKKTVKTGRGKVPRGGMKYPLFPEIKKLCG